MATRIPTRLDAAIFVTKVTALRARRGWQNLRSPIPLQRACRAPAEFGFVAAESRSPLWSQESLVEKNLQLGKVQNLRVAAHQINRLLVPKGRVFSFWRQVGRTSRRKRYAEGRELREACLIPSVGGGLCQLSNALYDTALQAGCDILERHAHSSVIPGSAAERGRDATVAWNHVDLRFRAPQDMMIEVSLPGDALVVRFRTRGGGGTEQAVSGPPQFRVLVDPVSHTCTDCGAQSCFRHMGRPERAGEHTAFLLDECWPEFVEYLQESARASDGLLAPMLTVRYEPLRLAKSRFAYCETAVFAAVRRALAMRRAKSVPARIQAQLLGAEGIAARLASKLSFRAAHVTVAQTYLPFLWREGELGGRQFDVLLTRLPLGVLHERLDQLTAMFPQRTTFGEYRAPQWVVEAEAEALAQARHLVTPHSWVARMVGSKAVNLDWKLPTLDITTSRGSLVVFPGPTVARKGAYELRRALSGTSHRLLAVGRNLEGVGILGRHSGRTSCRRLV